MGLVMDLVAGNSDEILLAVAGDDLASFDDRKRFQAHLTFGGTIDPTWLDLFSQAVRAVTDRDDPVDFLEARSELDAPGEGGSGNGRSRGRTIERIDPAWVTAVASVDDRDLDAVTGSWIDLLEVEVGHLPREEKPALRTFAREIVDFARAADDAPAVILAWSL
jgi:hypothetical protein